MLYRRVTNAFRRTRRPLAGRNPSPRSVRVTLPSSTLLILWFASLVISQPSGAVLRQVPPGSSTPAASASSAALHGGGVVLQPTVHPPLPRTADELWLVPASAANGTAAPSIALKRFAEGLDAIADDNYVAALPKVNDPRLARTPVADYAAYYAALAQLHTGHLAEARHGFNTLNAQRPPGVLREWGLIGEAEAAEGQGQYAEAAKLYETASMIKVASPDAVLYAQARNLVASGDRPRALTIYRRIYYEFPLSELADGARAQMLALSGQTEATRLRQDFALELGRAQRLFGSRRYAEALTAFEALRELADDDQRELIGLRIAESQYYLGRYKQALEGARPFTSRAARKAEARFFYLSALRGTANHDAYVEEARRLINDFPKDAWAEETLNNLGTHYILIDEDDRAIEVFKEYFARFPTGRYAQRAAWKIGWAAYREQRYQDTITVFEQAAAAFPRSDYRPPWLYWTARAYDQLGQADGAAARYALISVDYLNSYYGRLADVQLRKRNIISPAERRALAEPTAGAAAPTAATALNVTAAAAATADASRVSPSPDGATGVGASNSPEPGSEGVLPTAIVSPAATASRDSGLLSVPGGVPQPLASTPSAQVPREIETRIRQLITAGLYAPAIAEVDCARRQSGTSPVLEATLAWLYKAQGDLRRGINAMKRAYPQYLTADGHRLPRDVQKVIFPLEYWTVIKRHAVARGLDPYLIAALVAQESTFTADVRSSANAYGLMQVLPSNGRQLSRTLGIRRFTVAKLTDPEINVRMGTLIFSRLVKQFGGTHYALASYNAGENKVGRWIHERPPLPQDEFIDDIPYPETQNYVKRILGTAEDYRRLYGE